MSKAGSECWLRKLQSSCLLNKSRHCTLCHSAVTGFNLEHLIYLLWTGGLYKGFLGQNLRCELNRAVSKRATGAWQASPDSQGSPSKASRTKWGHWRGAKGAFSRGGTEFVGPVWDYTEHRSQDQVGAFVLLSLPKPPHSIGCWCLAGFWC